MSKNSVGPVISRSRLGKFGKFKAVDIFDSETLELYRLSRPTEKGVTPEKDTFKKFIKTKKIDAVWVYFPWRKIAVRTVAEAQYLQLRTARNRNLITSEEQENYRSIILGIAGLSVGSSAFYASVITGGPRTIKIADHDHLEVTNLNRVFYSLLDIGQKKAIIAAQRAWELDPFLDLQVWDDGLNTKTIKEFIIGKPSLDVFVDAIDDLSLKVEARKICKEHGIPVLMATDVGDGAVLEVERYDLDRNLEIFNGRGEKLKVDNIQHWSRQEWMAAAAMIIGPEFLSPRMEQSAREVGKTLAGIPQLGTAAFISGATLAYAVRCIANKIELASGRYQVDLEKQLHQ